jgi:phage-related protein
MATFTWTPSFGSPESSQPRAIKAAFGDGYGQRVRLGLNSDPKVWDLQFDNRTDAEREQIRVFLEARGGVEAFDWTTLWGQAGKKWICEEWSITPTHANNNQIRAKFQQVFEY